MLLIVKFRDYAGHQACAHFRDFFETHLVSLPDCIDLVKFYFPDGLIERRTKVYFILLDLLVLEVIY